jgi:transposase
MDHGSSPIDVAQLLARVQALESHRAEDQRLIAEQRATIAAQQEALQVAHEQITLLKKALFSPKRERYVSSPGQGMLFETVAVEASLAATPPATPEVPPPRHARKSRKKFVIPAFLPMARYEHKLNDEECKCGRCGQARVIIRSQTTRQIEIEPAKAHVEEHVRYTYACPKCREGGEMQTTPKPPKPLEKSPFGASVLALMIAWKFERHLPTYRQQEMFLAPLGIWLSRPLIAGLLQGSANELRPLADCLLQEILLSRVVQADETPIQYLGAEKGKSSTGYLFGYAGDAEHRFLFYDFRPDRSRAGPAEILADYQGVLLTDGHSAYEALVNESRGRLCAAACWMHARREFDEARATTSHPLVEETLARTRLLYDIEDRAKNLSFEERRVLRDRESRPLVERLFAGMDEECAALRPSSQLAKAVHYSLNRRVELSRFLDDGHLELDTGLLERSMRGPALGRTNYLFFGSLSGGRTAATLYSIVQSAKLYNLDVTAYLTDVLRRLPDLSPTDTDTLRELLPDRWAAAYPQHVVIARQQESREALEHRRLRRAQRRLQTVA